MWRWIGALALAALGCEKQPAAQPPGAPRRAPRTERELATPFPPDFELIARGGYIASLAGCSVCHTPGGGPLHAPNITSDPVTGLGDWSDTEIATAIRQGIRPDGSRMSPVMPYPYYHAMTDRDVQALVAYLRTLPPMQDHIEPVTYAPPPVVLPPPTDNVDPTWDSLGHGRYLAQLMHCGACHTPAEGPAARRTFAGGTSFSLAGGRVVYAPNLTTDVETGLGRWSAEDLAAAIRTMRTPEGEPIGAPMSAYSAAWARLRPLDAYALGTYVKAVPAVSHRVGEAEQPPTVSLRP